MNKTKIRIDVVSDVVCPWCYIGKRRLEKAIDNLSDTYDFEVEYHPFELDPQLPATGVDQHEYLAKKFGGTDRYAKIADHVSRVAQTEGLSFDFSKQTIMPNTRNAHRIIQLAKRFGKQAEANELLMKAYFTEGADLGKPETLVQLAVQAGLEQRMIEELLRNGEGLAEIEVAEREMHQLGISGVPFYIIQHKYGLSGAQPSDTFMDVFEEAVNQPEAG